MQIPSYSYIQRLRSYYRIALVLWTLLLTSALAATLIIADRTTLKLSRIEAMANFNKDQAFRFWAALHGGVYVPVSDKVQPNPRLSHIPERDIETPSGRRLTLMNPAWMMRQLNDQYAELYGVRGHITSERLMRPENAPDDWERRALHAFAQGADEVMEVTDIEGQPYLRFMRPMFAQEGCLKCHGLQGYKVGELRGGVSVSVPLAPYHEAERVFVIAALASYSGIWLAGAIGLTAGWRRLRRDHLDIERAKQEILHLNAGLEQRVRERTAELNATNQELEAFAYSVSHDLQAPLRAMSGFSQAILEDYADRLDDTGRSYLERIANNANKMGQLIADMLKLSRSTRGEMHHEWIDLSAIVGDVIRNLREEQPERAIDVVVQQGLHAHGDIRLLNALLDNLLRNAWKFTGRTEQARIEFGETQTERGRAFFVRDNGAGFDMTYVDKLFAPFKRLHSVEEFPGSGIGLAIVQRVVHRHGGEVWAEGAVGQGATFYFTLGAGDSEN